MGKTVSFFALLILLLLISSTSFSVPIEDTNEVDDESRTASDLSYLGPKVFGNPSSETGKKVEEWNEKSAGNPEELGEYAEGDILFPKNTRNGLIAEVARWKNGVVPYEIAGFFTPKDLEVINRAIGIYHKYTCIKFRKRTSGDKDYLAIVSGNTGCWSSVGRITGRQEVNLQRPHCTTLVGTPMHELMHAIGFLHEQNRWERDDFVTIAWNNIKSGHDGNFKKATQDSTSGYGVRYDYRSVMHYSPTAFSVNGRPTIIPKDSSKNMKMGQREGFSRGDIMKINAMYGCSNKLPHDGGDDINNNGDGGGGGESGQGGGGLFGYLFQIFSNR